MTDLQDLPPSAKLVVKVLEYADGSLTLEELAAETRLPERTVTDALVRLRSADLVERRVDVAQDARRHRYELTTLPND